MSSNHESDRAAKVAFVGTYVPRKCGIATFSADLAAAIQARFGQENAIAIAVNDAPTGYDYPDIVKQQVDEAELGSYRSAAHYLNLSDVQVVSLQHEYGIFGGRAGSYVLTLLRELRVPVVTTLHTVVEKPDDDQRRVMGEILNRSSRVVVMNGCAKQRLIDLKLVEEAKIDVIPHGIPNLPPVDSAKAKEDTGLAGKAVLLTFGLLSPGKGVETVIQALPAIIREVPNAVYAIVGATHPKVKEEDGESYRLGLRRLAERLGVASHVVFHDRFVDIRELFQFLYACDVYATPYLNRDQISSGTLAYALGAGRPVISTPYTCATELLGDGAGVLVPPKDPAAFAEAAIRLLTNEDEKLEMGRRAHEASREMLWHRVAEKYMESFSQAAASGAEQAHERFQLKSVGEGPLDLPSLKLGHLRRMTDHTGLLQHAIADIPNFDEGYCVDDNARALMLMAQIDELGIGSGQRVAELEARYLAFVWHSMNGLVGRFRNFMSYDRRWLEKIGSEDSHGRALCALGTVVNRSSSPRRRAVAKRLFLSAIPAALSLNSPRAWAHTLLGLDEFAQGEGLDDLLEVAREELASRLMNAYKGNASPDWLWFENIVSYSNAKLPHALIVTGMRMARPELIQIGLESLDWLVRVQTGPSGDFAPIGSNGHFRRGGEPARFDQQPIEAHATVLACLAAHKATGERKWYEESVRAFNWFLGANDVGLPLYDSTSGGCRDGLHEQGVNENMGAESTLAFLLSLVEMLAAEHGASELANGNQATVR